MGVVAGEGERAGAGFGEAASAADHAGVGRGAGGVRREREAGAQGEIARAGDGSEGLGGSDGQCAGVDRGGAGVGIRTIQDQGATAVFGEAKSRAGYRAADGEVAGVHSDSARGIHRYRSGPHIQVACAVK